MLPVLSDRRMLVIAVMPESFAILKSDVAYADIIDMSMVEQVKA